MRFSNTQQNWEIYKVSDLLSCVSTNSLTWNELSYDEESSLKNIHYGLIHNGFTTTCISCDNRLIPYVNINNFPKQYSCVEKGDIILDDASEDRKDVGRAIEIININDKIVISGLHTIHAKNKLDLLEIGYKGFYFNSNVMKKQIHRIANGSKIYSISPSNFNELYISIPNKHEQTKIVSLLSLIEQRIETQNKIIEELKIQKKYIIKSIFNNIYAGEISLFDLSDVYQPQTISSNDLNPGGKYPVYGANGIIGYYTKYNHENEQICLTCRGASVGTLNFSSKFSWITGNSMVINTDDYDSLIDKEYLLYHLMIIDFNKYITGSGQPQITRGSLKKLKVLLPNLEVQNKIKNMCKSIDSHIKIESKILFEYNRQKQFLLSNLFI